MVSQDRMIELLEKYGEQASKKYGQHYLINKDVITQGIKSLGLNDDVVLEIGPGLGFITDHLSKRANKVIAIEKDPNLVQILEKEYDWDNVEVIKGNILNSSLPKFNKIFSNVPFQISSDLITKFQEMEFEKAILILQRGFAEKILDKGERRTRLSILTQSRFNLNILRGIRKSSFFPKPEINASLVEFEKKENPLRLNSDLVRAIYQHKKKKLRNSIVDSSHELSIEREKIKPVRDSVPNSENRVYELEPEDILEIGEFIKKI